MQTESWRDAAGEDVEAELNSRLPRLLVELAESAYNDATPQPMLRKLCRWGVDHFGYAASAVLLLSPEGELAPAEIVAGGDTDAGALRTLLQPGRPGPWEDALARRRRTSGPLTGPGGVNQSRARGCAFAECLPMNASGQTVGVLALLGGGPPAKLGDPTHLQALADMGAVAILAARRNAEARLRLDQLQQALESRVLIEQAKGAVSAVAGIDVQSAFVRLRDHARSHNLRLLDVARSIVQGDLGVDQMSAGSQRRTSPAGR